MRFKSIKIFIFLGSVLCGCNFSGSKNNTFLALSHFYDPVFQAQAPKPDAIATEDEILKTDFAISEELARELKEAEALLNEPTISIDN